MQNRSLFTRLAKQRRRSLLPKISSTFILFASLSSTTAFPNLSSQSMSYTTTRDGAGVVTVAPRDESKQSATVVICHGLGDTAEGFVDVAEQLATKLPYVKFILPTAPTQPVTMNMGMAMPSWYDIVGLDERSNEKCKGIETSQSNIVSILEQEHETTKLPYSRMLLAGFSQGGALSLYTGLQLKAEQKLAGIVVMSGYMPASKQLKLTPGLETVPIFHGHGKSDPLVVFPMAQKTKEISLSKGITDYTLKTYDMQHTVIPQEIFDVLSFMRGVLPEDKSVCIKVKAPEEMSIKELKAGIKRAGLSRKTVGFMEKSEFVRLLRDFRETGK